MTLKPMKHRSAVPALGALLALTACATAPTIPLSTPSLKEKAMTTATETTPPKRIMDGSRPFTLPEIEERLLKVLALPPAQISKESVEKIFGVVLEGDESPWFFEEISVDKQVVFAVKTYASWPGAPIFRYQTAIKKTSENNKEEYWEDQPREIPAAYKFGYPEFVSKLEEFGWENKGLDSDLGNHSNYFMREGFLLTIHMDDYRWNANGQPDFSQTRLSRVVIRAPHKR